MENKREVDYYEAAYLKGIHSYEVTIKNAGKKTKYYVADSAMVDDDLKSLHDGILKKYTDGFKEMRKMIHDFWNDKNKRTSSPVTAVTDDSKEIPRILPDDEKLCPVEN